MIDFVWLIVAVLSLWLTGVATVGLIVKCTPTEPLPERAEFHGLAILLGVGVVSGFLFLWSLLGLPLRSGSLIIGLLGCLTAFAVHFRSRSNALAIATPATPWSRLVYLLLAAIWVSLTIQALLTPQRLWDERAIFGIKAIVLWEDNSINSEALTHPRFSQYHPRYPLLLPLAECYITSWLGHADDRWGKLIPVLLAGGLWLSFTGVLSRRWGRDRGVLWGLLLATIPSLTVWEYGFLSAQADAVLGAFHGLTVLAIWDGLRTRRLSGPSSQSLRPWIIGGLAAACAVFVKDEGLAFLLVDATAVSLLLNYQLISRRKTVNASPMPWRHTVLPLGWAMLFPAATCVVWFWHRHRLPTTTEMTYFSRLTADSLQQGWDTLSWSLPHLAQRLFQEWSTWGLTWWGVLVAVLIYPSRTLQREQLFLLADIVGALAALVVAGMLAPTPVAEHLGGSAHRFLLQIAPVGLLFIASQFQEESPAK
ncbi:MAG: hypothetical protein ACK5Q5_15320 [Planctomycetaceae bacterium]